MNKAEFIKSLRKNVAQGEVESAFEQLTAYLTKHPSLSSLYQDSLQGQAQFRKARRDATMGVVSSEQAKVQFNQSTQQLLHLIQQLEQGPVKNRPANSNRLALIVGLVLFAGIGAGIWWWVSKDNESPVVIQEDGDCPVFSSSSIFNILLLPFISLDESISKPHIAIASNLSNFKSRYNIDFDVKTYTQDLTTSSTYLATEDEAQRLGEGCSAQLIIWGTSESLDKDSTILQTRYKFLTKESTLPLNKLKLKKGTSTDKITSISSISTKGLVTSSIEESILLLFGLIAHETGNQRAAIETLEDYEPSDSASSLVSGMVLAENYLSLDMQDQALEAYDKVLDLHPDYALARNNRGILNYVKGNYQQASEDLSVVLEKDTKNTSLLEARGNAYLQIEQLKEAKNDYQQIRQIEGAKPEVIQKIKEINDKIIIEKRNKEAADSKLRRNPNDISALIQKAQTSKKLGEYETSIDASQKVLTKDPGNATAYANLIDVYHIKRDTQMIKETFSRARRSSVDMKEVNRLAPFQIERNRRLFITSPEQN